MPFAYVFADGEDTIFRPKVFANAIGLNPCYDVRWEQACACERFVSDDVRYFLYVQLCMLTRLSKELTDEICSIGKPAMFCTEHHGWCVKKTIWVPNLTMKVSGIVLLRVGDWKGRLLDYHVQSVVASDDMDDLWASDTELEYAPGDEIQIMHNTDEFPLYLFTHPNTPV